MIKIYKNSEISIDKIMGRTNEKSDVCEIVEDIIKNVQLKKDKALIEYAKKFDKVDITNLKVSKEEIDEAFSLVPKKFIDIITEAKENIWNFHKRQLRQSFVISEKEGQVLGQKITALRRVGVYVPGGTASYPSTVLMDTIPAKLAGVNEIIMTTPPSKSGKVAPEILVAAKIAGVDSIYKVGGAQAIAALAFGTESIGRVDKIVGPGNVFVAEAKRQVFGIVNIDMIAGPSEILIIADGTCKAKFVAADLLSQAEHDKLASAVLVTDSQALATKVSEELEKQIPLLPRCEIARSSIDNFGKIIICDNLEKSIDAANEIAPEHLELCVDNPFDYLDKIRNAGSIFLGKYCPESLGDYFAGPNHTLPTGGTARFSSPLGVDDFLKKSSFIYYTKDALSKVSDKVAYFAEKEGLGAHAKAATIRFED